MMSVARISTVRANRLKGRARQRAASAVLALGAALCSAISGAQVSGADSSRQYVGGFFPYAAFRESAFTRRNAQAGSHVQSSNA